MKWTTAWAQFEWTCSHCKVSGCVEALLSTFSDGTSNNISNIDAINEAIISDHKFRSEGCAESPLGSTGLK